jgi:hypothetical protein
MKGISMFDVLAFGIPEWLESLCKWWLTGIMGVLLYFIPLAVCSVVYAVKGIKIYFKLRDDRAGKNKNTWFHPDELTIGHIVGFTIISTCPGINLIAFLKETCWDIVPFIWHSCAKVLSVSLVPDSDEYKRKRKSGS